MTVYTLQAPMPVLAVKEGMKLVLQAIDPTTGAAVTGVTCSHWAIYGERVATDDGSGAVNPGPFMLVPGPDANV